MRIFRKWRNYKQKPPFGAEIDWSDSITQGLVGCFLFNEFGLKTVFSAPTFAKASDNTIEWAGNQIDFRPLATAGLGSIMTTLYIYFNPSSFTWIACGNFHNSINEWRSIADVGTVFVFKRNMNNTKFGITFPGVADLSSGLQPENGVPISVKAVEGGYRFFSGNKFMTVTTTAAKSGAAFVNIGGTQNWLQPLNTTQDFLYIFNRTLTDDEILRLHEEPYSFFLAPAPWFMIDLATSSTITLSSTLSPVSIITGTDYITRKNTGDITSTSTNITDLSISKIIDSNINNVTTTTSTLNIDRINQISIDELSTISSNIIKLCELDIGIQTSSTTIASQTINRAIETLVNALTSITITSGSAINLATTVASITDLQSYIIKELKNNLLLQSVSNTQANTYINKILELAITPTTTFDIQTISIDKYLVGNLLSTTTLTGDITITTAGVVILNGSIVSSSIIDGLIEILKKLRVEYSIYSQTNGDIGIIIKETGTLTNISTINNTLINKIINIISDINNITDVAIQDSIKNVEFYIELNPQVSVSSFIKKLIKEFGNIEITATMYGNFTSGLNLIPIIKIKIPKRKFVLKLKR